ncbi:MAG: GNAT family N-acetyltransferase, partial [Chloroherpetonaceae bacterium]|nr:GNAT family N-acetyltransferase [Chloroherpetonaceae bacterium]
MLVKKPYLIEFDRIGNPSIGYISVAEKDALPFQVRRIYWTYFTPHDVIRGGHAHRRLNQIIVSLSGTIKLKTETIDGEVKEFILDRPNVGLYIGEMTWREIQFSHNAVLLCIASEEYDEEDYIRNYEDFRKMTASLRNPVRCIEGLKTNLVEVTEMDAEDIARLRSNPEINRFLSSQKPISVEEQVEWIRQNRKRGDNFYFKITDKQGAFKGTISLYNIKNHEAEFGRFIATNPINAVEAEF